MSTKIKPNDPFFAWWCSLTIRQLDHIESVANVDAARLGWNAAMKQNATAVEPSDLVSAGDGLMKALAATEMQMNCRCGDFGPCKQCTVASVEAATAAEAWTEAKKDQPNAL